MKTIEKIKEEYAKENNFQSFHEMEECFAKGILMMQNNKGNALDNWNKHQNEIAQRAFNTALELAAEKAQVKRTNDDFEWKMIAEGNHFIEVSKSSILSLKINS